MPGSKLRQNREHRVSTNNPLRNSRGTFKGTSTIWNRMSSGTYMPPPVKTVQIPKGDGAGTRLLACPLSQTASHKRL